MDVPVLYSTDDLHDASALCIGLQIHERSEWPPLFGGFEDIYSVGSFWRKFWHQLARLPMVAIFDFFQPHWSESIRLKSLGGFLVWSGPSWVLCLRLPKALKHSANFETYQKREASSTSSDTHECASFSQRRV